MFSYGLPTALSVYVCAVLLSRVLRKPWFWSLEEAGQWRDVSGPSLPLCCCPAQSYFFSSGAQRLYKMFCLCPLIYFTPSHSFSVSTGSFVKLISLQWKKNELQWIKEQLKPNQTITFHEGANRAKVISVSWIWIKSSFFFYPFTVAQT